MDPVWEGRDKLPSQSDVAMFRNALPPTFDATVLSISIEDWIHQLESIFQASGIMSRRWVTLAVIQLGGEVASWWRGQHQNVQDLMWHDFCEMVTLRFTPIPESPEPEPDGNESRLEQFFELAHMWGLIDNETIETYIRRFERELVEE